MAAAGSALLPLAALASLFPVPRSDRFRGPGGGSLKAPDEWRLQWGRSPGRFLSPTPTTRGVVGGQANLDVRSWTGEGTFLTHEHGPGGQSEEGRGGRVAPLHLHGAPPQAADGGWGARASGSRATPRPLPRAHSPVRVEGMPYFPVNS